MLKKHSVSIFLVVYILIFSVISLFIGAYDISIQGILAGDLNQLLVLLASRVPRVLAIICTGVGMSIAGLIMQNLCMNKFVSPTTGATVASAQFGVLLSFILFDNVTLFEKTAISFSTSLIGTFVFVWFIQRIKFKDVVMVPLIGIMFSTVIGGLTNYFAYSNELTQVLQNTFVGSFSLILRGRYEIVFLVFPMIIIAFIYANHFNIVGMGESFSKNLGVNYNVIMLIGLSIAAIITASVIVTVGTISYIGLIVPNIVAMFRGDKIRGSILDVALVGAAFVLSCDIIARLVIAPYELPIDLISGIIGSALFIALLFKRLNPKPKKIKEISNA